MNNLNKVNNAVNKAQAESEAIQSQGLKSYLWNRPVKMPLALFLITFGAAFIVGAVLL